MLTFSEKLSRPSDGKSFEELAPRNFSFNSPYGACPTCDGLGQVFEVDPELVVPEPRAVGRRGRDRAVGRRATPSTSTACSSRCATQFDIDSDAAFGEAPEEAAEAAAVRRRRRQAVDVKFKNRYGRTRSYSAQYEGVIPYLKRRHSEAESDSAA